MTGLDLGAPAAEITRLAGAIEDQQLDGPTPCGQMDVAGLLAHAIGFCTGFRDGAEKIDGPTTSTPPGPTPLPGDWREQLPRVAGELAEAWRDPAAWDGETTVGGVTMPAPAIAGFGNQELVVHGWDLAAATGQSFTVEPANLRAVWEVISSIPDDPDQRPEIFGPRRPVADDAPLLDRVLAYAGRDPGWKPPL